MNELSVELGIVESLIDHAKSEMIRGSSGDDQKALQSGCSELFLSDRQKRYLSIRSTGGDPYEWFAPIEITLWMRDKLFSACVDLIKDAEASQAEAMTWRMACTNPNSNIERMFAIKSRRPEYRDNVPPPAQTVTNVRITLNGNDFDVSADCKAVEDA